MYIECSPLLNLSLFGVDRHDCIRKGPLYGAIIACYPSQLGDKCMLNNIPSNNVAMYLPIPKGIAYSD